MLTPLRFSYFIFITYVANDPAGNSCSLCGNVAGWTASVYVSGSAWRRLLLYPPT